MLDFTRRVLALRHAQPVLRRRHFFQGQVGRGARRKDIAWFGRDGAEMDDEDWADQRRQSLGMLLNGDLIPERDDRGERVRGDTLLVLLHAGPEDLSWRLPTGWGERWEVLLDTARPDEAEGSRELVAGCGLAMVSRSLVVLRRDGSRGRLAVPGATGRRGAQQQGAAEHESDAGEQDVAARRAGDVGGEETAEQHVGVDLAGQPQPQPEHQGDEQRLPPRRAERTPPSRPAERADQKAAGAAGGAAEDPGVEGPDRDGLETRREGGEGEE
jgi:hypothetical protein